MFIVALFITPQTGEQRQSLWTNKPQSFHTMEYHSAIKRSQLLTGTPWTHLKCIYQVKGANSNDYTGRNSIYVTFWKRQNFRQKTDQWLLKAGGGEGQTTKGRRKSGGDGTFVLYLDCGSGYVTVCICQKSQNCTLTRVDFTVHVSYALINLTKTNKPKTALRNQHMLADVV